MELAFLAKDSLRNVPGRSSLFSMMIRVLNTPTDELTELLVLSSEGKYLVVGPPSKSVSALLITLR